MEKLTMFGSNNEHLIQLITDQIIHNPSLNASDLYDEINHNLTTIDGYNMVTTSKMISPKNPTKIIRSANFQYVFEFPYLVVMNKYF